MEGAMELMGLLNGDMWLAGEAGIANPLTNFDEEKSSISSLKIIPVLGDLLIDPKLYPNNFQFPSETLEFLKANQLIKL